MAHAGFRPGLENRLHAVIAFAELPAIELAAAEQIVEGGNQFSLVIDLKILAEGQQAVNDLPGGVLIAIEWRLARPKLTARSIRSRSSSSLGNDSVALAAWPSGDVPARKSARLAAAARPKWRPGVLKRYI